MSADYILETRGLTREFKGFVLENVRIALQRRRGHSFDFWRSERVLDGLDGRARELIGEVGLSDSRPTRARWPSSCRTGASAPSILAEGDYDLAAVLEHHGSGQSRRG